MVIISIDRRAKAGTRLAARLLCRAVMYMSALQL